MTSILLTLRQACCGSGFGTADMKAYGRRIRRRKLRGPFSAFLRAVARGDALLLGVLRRGLLDHRPHDGLVGANPVGEGVPLPAVPLQEFDRPAPFMIHARDL